MSSPAPATIFLVHGSWGGPWVWDGLIAEAGPAAEKMQAVALEGVGDEYNADTPPERHIAQICDLLEAGDATDATLVGHSYGGLVVTAAAARCPDRVSRVVVLDGFIAADSCAIFDDYPAAYVAMESAFTDTPPAAILPAPAAAFGGEGAAAAKIDASAVPMPRATHEVAVSQDMSALANIERVYIRFTGFPVFAETAAEAAEAGWIVREVEAGHYAPLTDPVAVWEAIGF